MGHVRRVAGKIVEWSRWPGDGRTDKIDDRDSELMAFRNRQDPEPLSTRLLDALLRKGVLTEQDVSR